MGESDRLNTTWRLRRKSIEMARTSDKPTFPRSPRQLRAWLRDTDVGRRLFLELAKEALENECQQCQLIRGYPKVLIVVRRLGSLPGVEVYREKGVTIRLEELVDTRDDKDIEILAEELLEAQLPRQWKHMPHCRSESKCFHGVTAGRLLQTLHDLDELRIYREFSD